MVEDRAYCRRRFQSNQWALTIPYISVNKAHKENTKAVNWRMNNQQWMSLQQNKSNHSNSNLHMVTIVTEASQYYQQGHLPDWAFAGFVWHALSHSHQGMWWNVSSLLYVTFGKQSERNVYSFIGALCFRKKKSRAISVYVRFINLA